MCDTIVKHRMLNYRILLLSITSRIYDLNYVLSNLKGEKTKNKLHLQLVF